MLFCHQFFFCLFFFLIYFFKKNLSGIPSECQTVWIQIRPDVSSAWSGPKLFAKVISRQQKSPLAGKELNNVENNVKHQLLIISNALFSYFTVPSKSEVVVRPWVECLSNNKVQWKAIAVKGIVFSILLFISRHTIVAGYYCFTLVIGVFIHPLVCHTSIHIFISWRYQCIFTKLGMCVDIMEVWFGIADA